MRAFLDLTSNLDKSMSPACKHYYQCHNAKLQRRNSKSQLEMTSVKSLALDLFLPQKRVFHKTANKVCIFSLESRRHENSSVQTYSTWDNSRAFLTENNFPSSGKSSSIR